MRTSVALTLTAMIVVSTNSRAWAAITLDEMDACVAPPSNYNPADPPTGFWMRGTCDNWQGNSIEIYDDTTSFGPIAVTSCHETNDWMAFVDLSHTQNAFTDAPAPAVVPPGDQRQWSVRKLLRIRVFAQDPWSGELWEAEAPIAVRPHLCNFAKPTVANNRTVSVGVGVFTVYPGQCETVGPRVQRLTFIGECTTQSVVELVDTNGSVVASTPCQSGGDPDLGPIGLYRLVTDYTTTGLFRGTLRTAGWATTTDSPTNSATSEFAFSFCPSVPNVPRWPALDFWKFVPRAQQF